MESVLLFIPPNAYQYALVAGGVNDFHGFPPLLNTSLESVPLNHACALLITSSCVSIGFSPQNVRRAHFGFINLNGHTGLPRGSAPSQHQRSPGEACVCRGRARPRDLWRSGAFALWPFGGRAHRAALWLLGGRARRDQVLAQVACRTVCPV